MTLSTITAVKSSQAPSTRVWLLVTIYEIYYRS